MSPVAAVASSSSALAIAVAAICRGGTSHSQPQLQSQLSQSARSIIFVDKLYSDFYKLPESIRFIVSANVGTIAFFTLDRMLYSFLCQWTFLPSLVEEYKHAVSFFLAYLIQVASQHWLNAFFVYGLDSISTREKYLRTLIACYRVYAISLVGTTISNTALVKFGIDRTVSFGVTISFFACINYLKLKQVVQDRDEQTMNVEMPTGSRGGGGWIHGPLFNALQTERVIGPCRMIAM